MAEFQDSIFQFFDNGVPLFWLEYRSALFARSCAKKSFSAFRYAFSISSLLILSASVASTAFFGRPRPRAELSKPSFPFLRSVFLHRFRLPFGVSRPTTRRLNPASRKMNDGGSPSLYLSTAFSLNSFAYVIDRSLTFFTFAFLASIAISSVVNILLLIVFIVTAVNCIRYEKSGHFRVHFMGVSSFAVFCILFRFSGRLRIFLRHAELFFFKIKNSLRRFFRLRQITSLTLKSGFYFFFRLRKETVIFFI